MTVISNDGAPNGTLIIPKTAKTKSSLIQHPKMNDRILLRVQLLVGMETLAWWSSFFVFLVPRRYLGNLSRLTSLSPLLHYTQSLLTGSLL